MSSSAKFGLIEINVGNLKNPIIYCCDGPRLGRKRWRWPLIIGNWRKETMNSDTYGRPICPNCARPMPCTRIIRGFDGLPELHVYCCNNCGEVVTQAVQPGEQRKEPAEV